MTLGLHIATVMFGVASSALRSISAGLAPMRWWWSISGRWTSPPLQLPLFILLGEIPALRRDRPHVPLAGRLAQSAARWASAHQRGGVGLVLGWSGPSVATAATISTVALPAFKKKNYDPRMVLGSIAAGGSLGNLIPPGIALIIYGVLTNTSVARGSTPAASFPASRSR